jgi:hypothetical protein
MSINPHTGGNRPRTYQSHPNVLNFGSRAKAAPAEARLLYYKKANFKRWGFAQPTEGETLAFEMDDAYQLLLHGRRPRGQVSPEVLALVSDMLKHSLITARPVDPWHQHLDLKREANARDHPGSGHYLVPAHEAGIPKVKCHSFDQAEHAAGLGKFKASLRKVNLGKSDLGRPGNVGNRSVNGSRND